MSHAVLPCFEGFARRFRGAVAPCFIGFGDVFLRPRAAKLSKATRSAPRACPCVLRVYSRAAGAWRFRVASVSSISWCIAAKVTKEKRNFTAGQQKFW